MVFMLRYGKSYMMTRNMVRCMEKLEELITAYEADVSFPDVSGMEHLDMLHTRNEIADCMAILTDEQYLRVLKADKKLLQQAAGFVDAMAQIANIAAWRRHEQFPTSHWWWYLDVVAQLPVNESHNTTNRLKTKLLSSI